MENGVLTVTYSLRSSDHTTKITVSRSGTLRLRWRNHFTDIAARPCVRASILTLTLYCICSGL